MKKIFQKYKSFFWTDSQVVLNYISNESKRFKVFLANCVQMIRNNTNLSQWNCVDNPADSASRELNTTGEAKIESGLKVLLF